MEFLTANSALVKELARDGSVTMEELFTCYCSSPEHLATTIANVDKLAAFAADKAQFSRCMTGKLPYISLEGLIRDEMKELVRLADYLQLPERFERQIEEVIRLGTNMCRYEAILDWEDLHRYKFDNKSITCWIRIGDLEGVKMKVEPDIIRCDHSLFYRHPLIIAMETCNIELVKYIYAKCSHLPDIKRVVYEAIRLNSVELLTFLHSNGFELPDDCLYYALLSDVYEYIFHAENRGYIESATYTGLNTIDCFEFLYAHGCRFSRFELNCDIAKGYKFGKLTTGMPPAIREFLEKYLPW